MFSFAFFEALSARTMSQAICYCMDYCRIRRLPGLHSRQLRSCWRSGLTALVAQKRWKGWR